MSRGSGCAFSGNRFWEGRGSDAAKPLLKLRHIAWIGKGGGRGKGLDGHGTGLIARLIDGLGKKEGGTHAEGTNAPPS